MIEYEHRSMFYKCITLISEFQFFLAILQQIFDNILNRDIPWPHVPEELSYEAKDLIDK